MCSSRFFSLNNWSSAILQRKFFKKEKAVHLFKSRVKRSRLKKKCHSREEEVEDMKMMNMRLSLKNKFIIEENKRLREIARFLSQDNQALQAHIRNIKKSSICTLQS